MTISSKCPVLETGKIQGKFESRHIRFLLDLPPALFDEKDVQDDRKLSLKCKNQPKSAGFVTGKSWK